MIKIGCAAYSYRSYFEKGVMSYEDFVKEAYKIGLDGVEFTIYWLPSKDDKYLLNLKRLALYHGLPISGVGISTNFCTLKESEKEENIRKTIEAINIAYKLGAPVVRVFGGPVPEGYSIKEAINLVAENVKPVLDYAEDSGIVIALENHGGITERAEYVLEIVEKVGSPWFRVNLDLGNYRIDTYNDIAKTVPYAVHVHAKVSAGGRKLDYEKIREILESKGYNGFLSIEYEEKEDPKTGVPRFAQYLFKIFNR